MTHRLVSLSLIAALGCGRGDDSEGDGADARRFDARVTDAPMFADAPPQSDGPPQVDGPPQSDGPPTADAPPGLAPHLLLTEVDSTDADEFVEIYNPTDATIDLRNYYLADRNDYHQLPGHVAGNVTLMATSSDFLVRFPAGATIGPRQIITVATDGDQFDNAPGPNGGYNMPASYAIDETGTATATEQILVMGGAPGTTITDQGEMVVLFYWDGASDLVEDVDIMVGGFGPSATNTIAAKTAVDGPDADTTPTAYAADALSIGDTQADTLAGQTYKRVAFEMGNETQSGGGNGITGDDETSEVIRSTWTSEAGELAAGTPGTVPPELQ